MNVKKSETQCYFDLIILKVMLLHRSQWNASGGCVQSLNEFKILIVITVWRASWEVLSTYINTALIVSLGAADLSKRNNQDFAMGTSEHKKFMEQYRDYLEDQGLELGVSNFLRSVLQESYLLGHAGEVPPLMKAGEFIDAVVHFNILLYRMCRAIICQSRFGDSMQNSKAHLQTPRGERGSRRVPCA